MEGHELIFASFHLIMYFIMYDLIDLIDFTQTLVFPWQQPSELAEPKNLLFTSKRWSLQLITTL